MKKKDFDKYKGEVVEALPNTMFRVLLEDGRQILTTLKGSLRRRYIRIFPGDKVLVEMTEYDQDRGRIIRKFGKKKFGQS